jgi:hypothetical protein
MNGSASELVNANANINEQGDVVGSPTRSSTERIVYVDAYVCVHDLGGANPT